MIKLVRIDERLVHGQVAVVWSKHLGINRIVVADDEAANNDTQKFAMQMAVPKEIKLSVTTVEKAAALLNDPRAEKLKIFVVVKSPQSALKLVEQVTGIPEINVGNYGRMSKASDDEKTMLERNLFVTEEDINIFRGIMSHKMRVFYQSVPDEKTTEVEMLINRKVRR